MISEALKLMTGPKPLVIDVDDAAFDGGHRIGELEYEEAVASGDPDFAWLTPQDEWDAIALGYTSGTTGNPKGVDASPRRLSQCRQQHPGGQSRHPSDLSVDPADVSLQRLVFSMDGGCDCRRECLLA